MPTGAVAVIKRIVAVSITASGNVGYLFTLNGTANVDRIYRQNAIPANETLDLETRFVLNDGDQLYLRRLTNNLIVTVHGFEFLP